eukprot:SAG11_NODE_116_length_16002_cov_19.164560_13_plen_98_part_00
MLSLLNVRLLHSVYGGFDCVLFAIGRKPTTLALGLDAAGIKLDSRGQIEVNEYEDTNVENVHALVRRNGQPVDPVGHLTWSMAPALKITPVSKNRVT